MRGRKTSRGLLAGAVIVLSLAFASSASADSFIVLYKGNAVPSSAKADVQKAGGTFVHAYDKIGVAIARSDSASFATRLGQDKRVEGVSSTARFASRLQEPSGGDAEAAAGPQPGELPNAPATNNDTFSPLQWDMRQIHTPEAHAITGGSPEVVVGDIDTGTDYRHPDLRQNIRRRQRGLHERRARAGRGGGRRRPRPRHAHRGHDRRGGQRQGIVGVAPNVKLASIKAGLASGYFFPEAVVCSFMWAGDRKLDVTNNSLLRRPVGVQLPATTTSSTRSGRPSSGRSATRRARA